MTNIHKITPDPSTLMESTSSSAKIPVLVEDGSNWIMYKAQFLVAVYAKGLRRYIEGTENIPIPPTAPGVDPDANERYEAAQDKWYANHATVQSLLFRTLLEPLKLDIASKAKASEMWSHVLSRYDKQGDFVQVSLLTQMQQLRCEEGSDPRLVLAQLAQLHTEYAAADSMFWDESAYYVATNFAKVSSNGIPFSRYSHLIDSGASIHFEPHRNNFTLFRTITPVLIDSADGRKFYATGAGSIHI
ncbi:hypothetical protein C8Q80DRAFT_1060134, partial [Daedaleopsis nitida]